MLNADKAYTVSLMSCDEALAADIIYSEVVKKISTSLILI